MARQLLERETSGATQAAELAAAMQRAYERVSDDLRRTVGDDGYNALMARALALTQFERPLLREMRRNHGTGIHLDVASGVDGHGTSAASEALESLLAALVDILSDLIGPDMVRSLLDHDGPPPASRGKESR
jgi:hypothetical protein